MTTDELATADRAGFERAPEGWRVPGLGLAVKPGPPAFGGWTALLDAKLSWYPTEADAVAAMLRSCGITLDSKRITRQYLPKEER